MYSFGSRAKKKKSKPVRFGTYSSTRYPGRYILPSSAHSFGMGSVYSVRGSYPKRTSYDRSRNYSTLPRFAYGGHDYFGFGDAGWWRLDNGHAVPLDSENDNLMRLAGKFVDAMPPDIREQLDSPSRWREYMQRAVPAVIVRPPSSRFRNLRDALSRRHGYGEELAQQTIDAGFAGQPVPDDDVLRRKRSRNRPIADIRAEYYDSVRVNAAAAAVELEAAREENDQLFRTTVSRQMLVQDLRAKRDFSNYGGLTESVLAKLQPMEDIYEHEIEALLRGKYSSQFIGQKSPAAVSTYPYDMSDMQGMMYLSAMLVDSVYDKKPSNTLVVAFGDNEFLLRHVDSPREDFYHYSLHPLDNMYGEHPIDIFAVRGTANVKDLFTDAALYFGVDFSDLDISNYVQAVKSARRTQGWKRAKVVLAGHSLGAHIIEKVDHRLVDLGLSFSPYTYGPHPKGDNFIRIGHKHDSLAVALNENSLLYGEDDGPLDIHYKHSLTRLYEYFDSEGPFGPVYLGPIERGPFPDDPAEVRAGAGAGPGPGIDFLDPSIPLTGTYVDYGPVGPAFNPHSSSSSGEASSQSIVVVPDAPLVFERAPPVPVQEGSWDVVIHNDPVPPTPVVPRPVPSLLVQPDVGKRSWYEEALDYYGFTPEKALKSERATPASLRGVVETRREGPALKKHASSSLPDESLSSVSMNLLTEF